MGTILFEYYELKHIKQLAIVCSINSIILQNIRHSTAWIMSTRAHQYFLPWTAVIGLIDGSYSNWCTVDGILATIYVIITSLKWNAQGFSFCYFQQLFSWSWLVLMLLIGRWYDDPRFQLFFILIPCEFCDGLENIWQHWNHKSHSMSAWPVHLNWAVLNKWVNRLIRLWEFLLISRLSEFLISSIIILSFLEVTLTWQWL